MKQYKSIYKESQFDTAPGRSFVQEFLEILSQVKIFHWQTFGYAEHTALGSYYDTMGDLIDGFVESYQGCYGREFLGSLVNISISDLSSETGVVSYISSVGIYLRELRKSFENDSFNSTDLQNQLDEMIGATDKLKYLLTLK